MGVEDGKPGLSDRLLNKLDAAMAMINNRQTEGFNVLIANARYVWDAVFSNENLRQKAWSKLEQLSQEDDTEEGKGSIRDELNPYNWTTAGIAKESAVPYELFRSFIAGLFQHDDLGK